MELGSPTSKTGACCERWATIWIQFRQNSKLKLKWITNSFAFRNVARSFNAKLGRKKDGVEDSNKSEMVCFTLTKSNQFVEKLNPTKDFDSKSPKFQSQKGHDPLNPKWTTFFLNARFTRNSTWEIIK